MWHGFSLVGTKACCVLHSAAQCTTWIGRSRQTWCQGRTRCTGYVAKRGWRRCSTAYMKWTDRRWTASARRTCGKLWEMILPLVGSLLISKVWVWMVSNWFFLMGWGVWLYKCVEDKGLLTVVPAVVQLARHALGERRVWFSAVWRNTRRGGSYGGGRDEESDTQNKTARGRRTSSRDWHGEGWAVRKKQKSGDETEDGTVIRNVLVG